MASFKKIGGRQNNKSIKPSPSPLPSPPEPLAQTTTNSKPIHISQITSEQAVYFPIMTNNESQEFFEDSGLSYCFNQSIQDFALNLDHISITNLLDIETLTFADGTTMTTAAATKHNTDTLTKVYNEYHSLDTPNENCVVQFPHPGVYLITYYLDTHTNTINTPCYSSLCVYFNINENDCPPPNMQFIGQSGSFTICYDNDKNANANTNTPTNKTYSPFVLFQLTKGENTNGKGVEKMHSNLNVNEIMNSNSHITATLIAS